MSFFSTQSRQKGGSTAKIVKGLRVLYSTPLQPRNFGTIMKRTPNRSFWYVQSDQGEDAIIHKGDIICTL